MTHIPAPLPPQHTDPITQVLADAILERLNLDHLAARIADHLQKIPNAANTPSQNDLISGVAIRRQLGRRGRPMAHTTFQKNYLDTGLLRPVPNPEDRRGIYFPLADWLKLKKEIGK